MQIDEGTDIIERDRERVRVWIGGWKVENGKQWLEITYCGKGFLTVEGFCGRL